MQFSKDQLVSMIESRVGSDQAQEAAQQQPDPVVHQDHANLLNQFGIDPQSLVTDIGSAGSGTSI